MSDLDIGIPFNDSAPPSRVARHRRRRQRGADRRRSFFVFLVMITVFGLLASGAYYGYGEVKSFLTTPDYSGQGTGEVTIEVKKGETAAEIANTLFNAGVVKSAKAFTKAASENPAAINLQPGTYALRKQMSGVAALTMMLDPASKNVKTFLIKEGLTVKEILVQINKQTGIPLADLQAAAKDPAKLKVPDWAAAKPGGPLILEGFLFPAKYEIGPDDDATTVLSRMVAQTVKVMEGDGFIEAAAAINRTPLELLTVASLIEQEAVEPDFGKLSRVVYNRLSRTDYLRFLQFDSTTQYWLIQTGKGRIPILSNNELKNPKNNYSTASGMLAGLPPTPISNPGKAALDAAAHPEPGPWTYFVVTGTDRTSSFTDDYDEHLANVEKCRKIKRC